jgi:hypothetical protein
MIILDDNVVAFEVGKAVPPEDVNRVMRNLEGDVAEVATIRYSCIPLTFQFAEATDATIGNAQDPAFRTMRFIAPVSGVIQRAFVVGAGTFSDRVDVDIVLAGTSMRPTGATTPYLSLTSSSPVDPLDGDISDVNVQKVAFVAGQAYDLVVTAPAGGTFLLTRLDVTINVVVDCYATSGTIDEPAFDFDPFIDGVADGDAIAANQASVSAEVSKAIAAVGRSCFISVARAPVTGAPQVRPLPQMAGARASGEIERVYVVALTTANTGTVTAQISNTVPAVVATVTTAAIVSSPTSADSGALALPIDAGSPETTATDYTVTLSTTKASGVVRAYALVWVKHS